MSDQETVGKLLNIIEDLMNDRTKLNYEASRLRDKLKALRYRNDQLAHHLGDRIHEVVPHWSNNIYKEE